MSGGSGLAVEAVHPDSLILPVLNFDSWVVTTPPHRSSFVPLSYPLPLLVLECTGDDRVPLPTHAVVSVAPQKPIFLPATLNLCFVHDSIAPYRCEAFGRGDGGFV